MAIHAEATEFRATLGALGITPRRAAELFGVGPRSISQDHGRACAPQIEVNIRQVIEHALLDGDIAGVVVQRPRRIDDPIPRDLSSLAQTGERLDRILVGAPRPGSPLTHDTALDQLVIQEPDRGRERTIALVLSQQVEARALQRARLGVRGRDSVAKDAHAAPPRRTGGDACDTPPESLMRSMCALAAV